MANILKATKMVYNCFYDEKGLIKSGVTGELARMNLPEENMNFLQRFIEFMMNSKILNEDTRIYLTSVRDTVKGAFEHHNKIDPENPVNIKTGISNVDYARRKIIKYFDDDMLTQVIYYSRSADLEKYQKQLEEAMGKFSRGSIFEDKVIIRLPKAVSTEQPTEEDINNFKMLIGTYRVIAKQRAEQEMKDQYLQVIGYFNFLSSKTNRNEAENQVYMDMLNYLNCEPVDDILDF